MRLPNPGSPVSRRAGIAAAVRAKRNRDDQWHRTRRQFRRGAQCNGFTLLTKPPARSARCRATRTGTSRSPISRLERYSLAVELAGFKAYRQHGIELTAGADPLRRRSAPVRGRRDGECDGGVRHRFCVAGERREIGRPHQLGPGEHGDPRPRLPGHAAPAARRRGRGDGREAPGPDGIRNLYINGARENQKNITIDGVTSMDSGSNSTTHTAPTLGTIAEVKVLTSAYQAEYGRAVGGTIIVTTRGGGRQYHGSGFWSHRHEEFNANDYFNNQRGVQKSPYRFNLAGWNLGGPVWPKNPKQFEALLFLLAGVHTAARQLSPTAGAHADGARAEGDYTQTLDLNQRLVTVYDPLPTRRCRATSCPPTGSTRPGRRCSTFCLCPTTRIR